MMLTDRMTKVRRVLVMLDYGDGDEGEVFDLTALVQEMLRQAKYGHADLTLRVKAEKSYSYSPDNEPKPPVLAVEWGGDAGEWVSGAKRLEDVINYGVPDGDRVQAIRRRESNLRKKADSLKLDAMRAKLEQVAAIRHTRPIARVDMSALPSTQSLPDSSTIAAEPSAANTPT